MRRCFGCALLLAALFLSACASDPDRSPAIGEAYIGPATLNIRKEIDPKSPTVAVAHHGDHVEIVGQRRLWYRIRTDKGMEGWADDRQLLDDAQMARLRKLAEETAGLPSEGKATTYDLLNVHTEPTRTSASFVQLQEKAVFDVIAHRITPRVSKQPKRQLIRPKPKSTGPPKKSGKKKDTTPPPPAPAPPPPPSDWIALSKAREAEPDAEAPPVALDDWTLIRTATGQTGWVLTSRVYMSIPYDVAQYAEGDRIVSYFAIDQVDDGGEAKNTWLWTTAHSLGQDYDFDSYRVFVWSLRHHRYETAYIQRRERGYLPVIASPGAFSVCVENKAGERVRKSYTLVGNAVRPAGERPCEVLAGAEAPGVERKPIGTHPPAADKSIGKSIMGKVRAQWKAWFGKSKAK